MALCALGTLQLHWLRDARVRYEWWFADVGYGKRCTVDSVELRVRSKSNTAFPPLLRPADISSHRGGRADGMGVSLAATPLAALLPFSY